MANHPPPGLHRGPPLTTRVVTLSVTLVLLFLVTFLSLSACSAP